jgi:hypothetical protein
VHGQHDPARHEQTAMRTEPELTEPPADRPHGNHRRRAEREPEEDDDRRAHRYLFHEHADRAPDEAADDQLEVAGS